MANDASQDLGKISRLPIDFIEARRSSSHVFGGFIERLIDVDSTADHDSGSMSDGFDQDPADFLFADQHVVGPLELYERGNLVEFRVQGFLDRDSCSQRRVGWILGGWGLRDEQQAEGEGSRRAPPSMDSASPSRGLRVSQNQHRLPDIMVSQQLQGSIVGRADFRVKLDFCQAARIAQFAQR